MMSYLWILLLGGLLATSAKAQDDGEEAGEPENPVPEADPTPEEPDAVTPADTDPSDGDAEPTAAAVEDSDANPAPEDGEPTPAVDDAEPTPAVDDAEPTPALDDAEPTPALDDAEPTPALDDAEPTAPAVDDGDATDEDATLTPTDAVPEATTEDDTHLDPLIDEEPTTATDEAEPTNPADVDEPTTDVIDGDEAEATTAAPADGDAHPPNPVVDTEAPTTGGPAVDDPEVTQTVEATPPVSTEAAPGEKDEPDNEPTTEAAPAKDTDQEEPTDSATNEDIIIPGLGNKVRAIVPEDGGLNLEDGLPEQKTNSENSRMMIDPGVHSAASQENVENNPKAQKASSGTLASILCAIGVAAVGAVTGYFTYQRKQLCFKSRQEADAEAGRKADAAEAQSDPQVLNTLLNSSQTSNQ